MNPTTTKKKNDKNLNALANNRRNKFALVVIDETSNWRDDIAAKAKKIEGVYLIDLTKPTNLCELAVSYYATFVKNFFQDREAWDDEQITELESDNGGEPGMYISGNSVLKVAKMYQSGTLEDAEENERANPTIC
jgi:hypothetical protein